MSNEWFDALSEASSGTLAIFTAVSGFIVLLLVRLWRNSRFAMDPPPEMQSVEIEGTDGARRTTLTTEIVTRQYPDVGTVYESFLLGVKISGDGPCLGTWDPDIKKYTWLTYNQVHERATYVGAGLVAIGCEPSQKTFIGIYGPNRVEWTLTDLGCQMFSMISVPVYDAHGTEECIYIINHAGLSTIVCNEDKVSLLLEQAHSCKGLKNLVKIGSQVTQEQSERAKELGLKLISLSDLEDIGKKSFEERKPAKPEDIFTVCYTSGTTGPPKGAILTHANLVADISAYRVHMRQTGFELTPEDVHLSFLPLAHMYERINHLNLLLSGARIGYYSGDIKRLLEDCKELKPTIFSAVPRLLNRIYDKVMSGVSKSKLKRWIFQMALRSKESDLKRRIISKNTIWDYLVLRKVQNLLGGRVRYMPCGSAPLSAKVTSFIRCVMGCYLTEGYGQTECAAAATFQLYNDLTTAGHVGPPVPSNIIKLVDVEEKAYFAKNGQGEICLKGPSVFKGYLHDPEKTAETIDEDGWLHTGDIGEWLPNGTLKIIDRKKNIFKLSQGEFIAPEKIQNVYLRSPFIAQVFVYGNSYKSFLVAIAVPDIEVLQTWAKSNGLEGDIKQLCQDEIVHKVIFQDMLAKGNEGGLNSLEQVKKIYLHPDIFSIENGLLTPTFKAKRPEILRTFKEEIERLYEEVEMELTEKTKQG